MCDLLENNLSSKSHLRTRIQWVVVFCMVFALASCNLGGSQETPVPTPDLPTVEFLFPQNGSTVLEGTDLSIDLVARDSSTGIVRIELLVDGEKINEAIPQDAVMVPVFRVNMNWLAQGVGLHPLSAVAFRLDGTSSDEAIISVEVLPRP
jgi:hypothetical protein